MGLKGEYFLADAFWDSETAFMFFLMVAFTNHLLNHHHIFLTLSLLQLLWKCPTVPIQKAFRPLEQELYKEHKEKG